MVVDWSCSYSFSLHVVTYFKLRCLVLAFILWLAVYTRPAFVSALRCGNPLESIGRQPADLASPSGVQEETASLWWRITDRVGTLN